MAKKYLDSDGLLYYNQKVNAKLGNKVDKVDGKGLSTNDYTTAEKTKLAGIETGANKTTVENSLTSTSTTNALSANQGKVLDEKIENVMTNVENYIESVPEQIFYWDGQSGSTTPTNIALFQQIYDTWAANKKVVVVVKTSDEKTVVFDTIRVDGEKFILEFTNTFLFKGAVLGANLYTQVYEGEATVKNGTVTIVNAMTLTLYNIDPVEKDGNKVLSTNDYTTAEKNKLAGIAEGANKTVINNTLTSTSTTEALSAAKGKDLQEQIDGTVEQFDLIVQMITSQIPTDNSQLTNGAGYQTASQVTTLIGSAIADIQGISYEIVTSLPSTGEAGVIYLKSNSGSNPNSYDEYIYVNNKFEKIGTTDVDLSGYVQDSDLVKITNAEIDTICS